MINPDRILTRITFVIDAPNKYFLKPGLYRVTLNQKTNQYKVHCITTDTIESVVLSHQDLAKLATSPALLEK